jgi:hypothetical protein
MAFAALEVNEGKQDLKLKSGDGANAEVTRL